MQGFTSSTLAHLRADERWREGEMSGSSRDSEPQVYRASENSRRPCLSLCPPYAHKAHTCNNNKLKQDKSKPQPSVVACWITRSLGYSGQNQEDNNTDNEGKTEAWAILTNHDRVQRSRLAC